VPRAIWTGSISFGLVNVPVRMYSAVDEQDVRFHLLHEKDDSRIGYEKICKEEGRPVPDDEIVRGYEVSVGE
jgi:DNA end-binding protein Ku